MVQDNPTGAAVADPNAAESWQDALNQAGLGDVLEDQDFKSIPDEQKLSAAKAIIRKSKNFQADYSRKTEDIKKQREELTRRGESLTELENWKRALDADPNLNVAVRKAIDGYRNGGVQDAKPNMKALDQAITQETDPARKETLRELKSWIQDEVSGYGESLKKYESLETEIKSLRDLLGTTLSDRVESGLNKVTDVAGQDFMDKYADEIRKVAKEKPALDVMRIARIVGSDDWDEAVKKQYLSAREKEKEEETKRKKAAAEPRRGNEASTGIQLVKDKKGRINTRELVRSVIQKRRGNG